jgi:hypothetical protein
VAGFAVGLAAIAGASLTLAAPHHPQGEYAPFADCPLSRETISACVSSVTTSGSFTIGQRTVPIKKAVAVRGGYEGASPNIHFFGAEDGNTLERSPQPLSGGLLGVKAPTWWPEAVQDWFNEGIEHGLTGVNATLELAGPATAIKLDTEKLIFGEGAALGLPVKFKLENPLLGSNCYIGSDAKPIQIDLTSGVTAPPPPNKPIKGGAGKITFNKTFEISTLSGARLVNNAFAVPAASGCGGIYSTFVDPLVNSILGTPAAAGRNTAILEGVFQDGASSAVLQSEG